MLTGFIWLRYGPVLGCCEHGNDPSGSIKGVTSWMTISFSRKILLHGVGWLVKCNLVHKNLVLQAVVFRAAAPRSLVVGNQRFGDRVALSSELKWIHLLDHELQPWRWRQHGLRNVGFQPPNYTAQQPRKPWLLFLCRENVELRTSFLITCKIPIHAFGGSLHFWHLVEWVCLKGMTGVKFQEKWKLSCLGISFK